MAGTAAMLSCSVRVFPSTALLTSTQTSTESSTFSISRLHLRAPRTRSVSQTLRSSQRSRKGVVRASLKGEGEKVQEFASEKAVEGVPQLTEYAKNLSMGNDIEEVKKAIEKVEQDILDVERELKESVTGADVAHLREEEKQLQDKERQLRGKKMLLLRAELSALEGLGFRRSEFTSTYALAAANERVLEGVLPGQPGLVLSILKAFGEPPEGPPLKKSKSLPEAPSFIQQFVRSAKQNFLAYKQKKLLAVSGDSQEKSEFLVVCGDPLGIFRTETGYLIWIRKCYEDLMRILVGAEKGERFIFRGTEGVGKSLFTLVWISYLATQRKKVVLKVTWNLFYLLDFTLVEAKSFGPFLHMGDLDLQDVLCDSTVWLILDGRQGEGLGYPCHMLLACSNKKTNYHGFAKHPKSRVRYVPVWTEEEVEDFLVDFEPHRSVYGHMSVPDKGTVMKNFRLFGGVPRCVFDRERSAFEEQSMTTAIQKLDTCLMLFARYFGDEDDDKLVHMTCLDDTYSNYQYDFASQCVLEKIWQQLLSMAKLDTVHYLEKLLSNPYTGAAFGSIFKLVAHSLVAEGGNFKMKKVCEDGKLEAVDDLMLGKGERKVFEELGDLRNFQDGDYCQPKKKNLQSVDAVILPNIVLQFFHYTQRNHGYKIKGLQDLDDVLEKPRYRLFACVPEDTYDSTGFQNFLGADGKQVSRGYKKLQGKMDQYVVMVDFKRYRFL